MSLSEFLKKYREEHGLSMDDFAKRSGLSKPYISMLEKNRNSRGGKAITPSIRTYEKIALAVGLSVDGLMRLLNGDEMVSLAEETEENSKPSLISIKNIVPVERRMVPVIGTIAAGEPIFADEHIEAWVPCDARCHVDFGLKVQGDSMIDAGINDGDIVFIQQVDDVDDGQIAAVCVDDSATLKYVYKGKDGVTLSPANHSYRPMHFDASNCDTIRIVGRAVAKFAWLD